MHLVWQGHGCGPLFLLSVGVAQSRFLKAHLELYPLQVALAVEQTNVTTRVFVVASPFFKHGLLRAFGQRLRAAPTFWRRQLLSGGMRITAIYLAFAVSRCVLPLSVTLRHDWVQTRLGADGICVA